MKTEGEDNHSQAREWSSGESNHPTPLILDFQPPELQEDKLPLLKTSSPVVH
jgi:hypothetical protein